MVYYRRYRARRRFARRGSRKTRRVPRRTRAPKRRIMRRKRTGTSQKLTKRNKVLPYIQGVAKSRVFKLRYNRSEVVSFAGTANGISIDMPIFRVNDINDPDYRVGGGLAQPWDIPDKLYTNWKVMKSRITYHFTPVRVALGGNPDSTYSSAAHFTYKLDNDGAWNPAPTNWSRAMIGSPTVKHKFVEMNKIGGFKIVQNFNLEKHFGAVEWGLNDHNTGIFSAAGGGGAGTSPTTQVESLMRVQAADFQAGAGSVALPNMNLDVQIDFVVLAFNPRDMSVTTGN